MSFPRVPLATSLWWALGSLLLMVVGAFGPWAHQLGSTIDGTQDEVVLLLALFSAVMLVALAGTHQRRLALVPLIAGTIATVLSVRDLRDVGDITSHVDTHLTTVGWGLYLTAIGSISLTLTSMLIIAEHGSPWPRRRGPRAGARPAAAGAAEDRDVKRRARTPRPFARRQRFFDSARVMATHLGVEVDGMTFIVLTGDERSELLFTKHRLKEWKTLKTALKHLDRAGLGVGVRGRVFLDVGANLGTPCIPAVSRHGFTRAIAFEADPGNFGILQANIAINRLEDKIESYNVAVSHDGGVVQLALDPESSGGHRIGRPAAGQSSTEVPAVALDEFLPEIGIESADVGLLWVDVEGHEPEVLRGASALLAARVPIVVEVSSASLALVPIVRSYSSLVDVRRNSQPLPLSTFPDIVEDLGQRQTTDVLLLP